MSKSNPTLTSVLVGTLRWSGKTSFILFFLGIIIVSGAVSLADPNLNYYEIQADQPALLLEKYIDGDDLQFGIATDPITSVRFSIFRLEFLTTNADNVTATSNYRSENAEVFATEVFSINAPEFIRDIPFPPGTYQFVVVAESDTGILFGQSSFNPGAIVLSLVFLVMFSLTISLFFMVLPFAIFLLILNAVTGSSKPKAPRDSRRERPSRRQRSSRVQSEPSAQGESGTQSIPSIKSTLRREGRSVRYFNFETFAFEKYTGKFMPKDWSLIAISILFLFMSIVIGGPFFFFFLIILIGTIYRVAEREKIKDRMLILLNHYPETNLDFLTTQLGERKMEKVHEILQIMILDDGYPIQFNAKNNTIRVVGDLPQKHTPSTQYQQTPVQTAVVTETQPVSAPVSSVPVESVVAAPVEQVVVEAPVKKEVKISGSGSFCTGCGEEHIKNVKYCYTCGQKI